MIINSVIGGSGGGISEDDLIISTYSDTVGYLTATGPTTSLSNYYYCNQSTSSKELAKGYMINKYSNINGGANIGISGPIETEGESYRWSKYVSTSDFGVEIPFNYSRVASLNSYSQTEGPRDLYKLSSCTHIGWSYNGEFLLASNKPCHIDAKIYLTTKMNPSFYATDKSYLQDMDFSDENLPKISFDLNGNTKSNVQITSMGFLNSPNVYTGTRTIYGITYSFSFGIDPYNIELL